MSFALLQTALLVPVEFAVNRVLALDAASAARLARLEGRTLALQVTQPPAQLFISARSQHLHLAAVYEGEPDASLRGPLSAMAGLLLRGEKVSSLPPGLELRGNTSFVQDLQTLLLDLDMDWEYQLGRFIGDMPTEFLGKGMRQTRDFLRSTAGRLHEDTVEYLQEETRLVPAPAELEEYYKQVGDLILRTDRLQARINSLASRQESLRSA